MEPPSTVDPESTSYSILYGVLPFGIPQFENGDQGKGVAFLMGESFLLSINVASYWLSQPLRDADATPTNHRLAETLFYANVASAIGLGALLLWGAWDGISNRDEKERQNE